MSEAVLMYAGAKPTHPTFARLKLQALMVRMFGRRL